MACPGRATRNHGQLRDPPDNTRDLETVVHILLTERLSELVLFVINRSTVTEMVRQYETGQGSTSISRSSRLVGVGMPVTGQYAKQGASLATSVRRKTIQNQSYDCRHPTGGEKIL